MDAIKQLQKTRRIAEKTLRHKHKDFDVKLRPWLQLIKKTAKKTGNPIRACMALSKKYEFDDSANLWLIVATSKILLHEEENNDI